MTSPLDSRNSHGIEVVADRGPLRPEMQAAFAKGARTAIAELDKLTKPSNGRARTAKTRAK